MFPSRCPSCIRPFDRCLCSLIPSLPSRTRILLLQHPSEQRHALNTARLAAMGLQNAELRIGELFPDLEAQCRSSGRRPYLLFPGEHAQTLGPDLAIVPDELLLIVPDGTWRKARKLLHLDPFLEGLPRLTLPSGADSRYRLRKAPGPGALATIEAVVRALNLLESPACFDSALVPFERMIDDQIEAMGPDVYGRNHLNRR
ncbi:tRNA-uridine aminocarboxypropyltransferase [Pseudomonas sp. Marseille-QA0892]